MPGKLKISVIVEIDLQRTGWSDAEVVDAVNDISSCHNWSQMLASAIITSEDKMTVKVTKEP